MKNRILVRPKHIVTLLSIIAAFLVCANIVLQRLYFHGSTRVVLRLLPLFNLDREYNIPAAFSGLLLLFAALLLLLITALKNNISDPLRLWWLILCVGFFVMGIDEMFKLHENLRILGVKILALVGVDAVAVPAFQFTWVVTGIVLVLILLLFFIRFLKELPGADRVRFLLAASIYLAGAIGMEMAGSAYGSIHGMENFTYTLIVTIEESLELAGTLFFISALFRYITIQYPRIDLHFTDAEDLHTDQT